MTSETVYESQRGLDESQARVLEDAWQEVEPATARKLLIAAVEAFAISGYHGTTTREIARRASMSPAGVYVHYRSKEELLYQICHIGHRHTLEMLRAASARGTDPAARLTAVISDFTAWQARYHTTARIIEYDLNCLSAEHYRAITAQRRQISQLIREILDSGVHDGMFDIDDVTGAARAVLSLGTDVARWYHTSTDGLQPEELGRFYASLALRMVRSLA
jgi:AcrR family transcriptional regulator